MTTIVLLLNSNDVIRKQSLLLGTTTYNYYHQHIRFELYGWQPDLTLSDDKNYIDLVMLITQNSIYLQGYMGCVIVNPNRSIATAIDDDIPNCKMPHAPSDNSPLSPQQQQKQQQQIYHGIIGVSTNLPLFTPSDSDIHAEIGAIGLQLA